MDYSRLSVNNSRMVTYVWDEPKANLVEEANGGGRDSVQFNNFVAYTGTTSESTFVQDAPGQMYGHALQQRERVPYFDAPLGIPPTDTSWVPMDPPAYLNDQFSTYLTDLSTGTPNAYPGGPIIQNYPAYQAGPYASFYDPFTNLTTTPAPTAGENLAAGPAHSSQGQMTQSQPPASGPQARRRKMHACKGCPKLFDRKNRAHDHAYKDRGESPYYCGGKCGNSEWYVEYISSAPNHSLTGTSDVTSWSREHLMEHINREMVECPGCSRSITKKNVARHLKESCARSASTRLF
ncbi:hypothetical protein M408DRAFT_9877 [Serendipita vermifera MAFF 305830]|uniref:C2H2-type domain-containing protein n=1 Tax=Serendipita vermifera MAFF 305830 TaxID=933852 RepID=A0A0C2WJB4_SERVB|nr:hypothetical protein M408DRAFT_9877 [Serendipita vermifera MAFF 305830]